MIEDIAQLRTGQKVHYKPDHYVDDEWEIGDLMNLKPLDYIQWIIGAEHHQEPIGPVQTGQVYAIYPQGKGVYSDPFLMAWIAHSKPDSIDGQRHPFNGIAVSLNNPTLQKLKLYSTN